MMDFSPDPVVAKRQMLAVLFYLTAFAHVDGELSAPERRFIRDYVSALVDHRAREHDSPSSGDAIARWTAHLHGVVDAIDRELEGYLSESVLDGEGQTQFVRAKIELRCYELFQTFDDESRERLLSTVDELMLADGVVHVKERELRDELRRLLAPAASHANATEAGGASSGPATMGSALFVESAVVLEPKVVDHPFFAWSERPYPREALAFARQSQQDVTLVHKVISTLDQQRLRGAGKLGDATGVAAFRGSEPFLDGHVYVVAPKPRTDYELLVLGDLHGCYSCLKAALMQADFFGKVEAYRAAPDSAPEMRLVLLGDYIDRGRRSYDGVLRAAMRLFVTMPEHVVMLRGNHEYYIEHAGRILAPVRPAEGMDSLAGLATFETLATYMRLFEALPTTLLFDRLVFVHAGIPREEALAAKWTGLASLNDPDLRFQMLWSDPSDADVVPPDLQKASARFSFGRHQLQSFLARIGCYAMIRGHERLIEGFRTIYDAPDATLLSVFSAGGKTNADLPETSNYREVTPMALTVRHRDGITRVTPFAIDYARYNDPANNAFFGGAAGGG